MRSRSALSSGLLLLLVSCGGSAPGDADLGAPQLKAPPAGVQGPGIGSPLLTLLLTRSEDVLFLGERTVTANFAGETTVHRELVASDGQGNFLLEPIEYVSGHDDPALFLLLEAGRAPYAFRYRDFQVEDASRLAANYVISELPSLAHVAGQATLRLEIRRRTGDGPIFRVDLHPINGLVLAYEEWVGSERVLAVRFDTIEFQPDLSPYNLGSHRFTRTLLDPSQDLNAQLGFKVLEPQLLPPGYSLEEVSVIEPNPTQPEDTWVRCQYGDGLASVVLLQRKQVLSNFLNGAVQGSVRLDTVGGWTFVTGQLDGHEMILAGRASESFLLEMLQSAL